jgi:hypothetical protein
MVLEIDPYSPLSDVRHNYQGRYYMGSDISPEKISIKGYIKTTSNEDMHESLESLAGAVGYYGGEYRESALQIVYAQADQSAGESAILRVRCTKIKTKQIGDRNRSYHTAIEVDIDFDVIGYINPDGLTIKSYSGITYDGYCIYWQDTDSMQGADNLKFSWKLVSAGSFAGYYFLTIALAVRPGFELASDAVETGTRSMVLGQFGNPAMNFASGGDNTYKDGTWATLPIARSQEHTTLLKFKWSGDAGADTKTLLEASTGDKYQIFINTNTQQASFKYGSNTVSISSATQFSSTDWNVIAVRCQSGASGQKIWLKIPGQDIQTASASAQGSQYTSNPAFYLGTNPDGDERCDCAISEAVIWKHPLSDDAVEEALSREMPIKVNTNFGLNRRITYYQDYSHILNDTVYYLQNPFTWLQLDSDYATAGANWNDGDIVTLDADKRKMTQMSSSGAVTNLLQYIESWERFEVWPIIERYNKLYFYGIAGLGLGDPETDFSISYNAKRRM